MNKKIAIVLTFGSPIKINSYNVQEIGIGKELIKLGYSVDIYSKFYEINSPKIIEKNLKLIPIKGIKIWKNIVVFPNLTDSLVKEKYHIIQVHGDMNFMNPLILKRCRTESTRTVMVQGMYKNYTGLKSIIQNSFDFFFKNTIIKNSDYIFAKTNEAKNHLQKKGYNNIYNYPIGLDIIQEEGNKELETRIKEFSSNFSTTLLYIGVIDSRRKVEFLIELLKKLKDKNIGLIIVGKGSNLKNILNLIDIYELKNNIFHIDHVKNTQMHIVYKGSDILLLPSTYEIWGMIVLEALYFGLPVISTPTAGPKTILRDISSGVCLNFNINDWINQVIFYQNNFNSIENKEKRKKLVVKKYNWKYLAKKYIEIVENEI